jgi:hypothetical protein
MASKEERKAFKALHGKTKLGMFLQDNGPDLLKTVLGVAGSFVPGASGITNKISSLIKGSNELSDEQKVEAEAYLSILDVEMKDLADARSMYKSTDHVMADEIADKIIKFNLPVIIFLVLANVAAVMLLEGKGEVIAIVSNFIGIAIGNLFTERQSVVNFFFGSSRGSKDKQEKLDNM